MGSNVGDQAIIAGTINYLRKIGIDQEFKVLCNNPMAKERAVFSGILEPGVNATLKQWDTKLPILRSDIAPTVELLEQITSSTAFMEAVVSASGFSCGNAYLASGEVLFSRGDAESDWALLGYLLPFLAAIKAGIKVVVLPATYGPFESDFSKKIIHMLLSNCEAAYSRDGYTKYLSENNAKKIRDGLDMAYFLPRFESPNSRTDIGKRLNVTIVPRLENFGLRLGSQKSFQLMKKMQSDLYINGTSYKFYTSLIAGLLRLKTVRVNLLTQSQNDLGLNSQILRSIQKQSDFKDRITLKGPSSLNIFLDRINRADILITSRIHSAIFATALGIPTITAVTEGHGHKSANMMKIIGLEKYCLKIADDKKAAYAQSLFENILSDYLSVSKKISHAVGTRKEKFLVQK